MLEANVLVFLMLYLLRVVSTDTLLILLQILFVLTTGSILFSEVRKSHHPKARRFNQNSNLVFERL